jgi:hypothetical protein
MSISVLTFLLTCMLLLCYFHYSLCDRELSFHNSRGSEDKNSGKQIVGRILTKHFSEKYTRDKDKEYK